MSEFFEINPGDDNDQEWDAISDFVTHLAETNESLEKEKLPEPTPEIKEETGHKAAEASQPPEIQKSESYTYLINDFGDTGNNFQYIRKEVHELLSELGEIRAARAGLQERLHNLNI